MDTNATMIPFYKERVKEIENEILAIANNAPYADLSEDKAAYLLTLLNDRKGFLDAMFVVTPEEFARVNEVNERLRELSHELHNQIAGAHEMAKRAFLGKDFTVEATLKFVSKSDGAMIVRPNGDYYGSDFTKIMRVVDMMDQYNIGYGSVNHNRNRCLDCGHENSAKNLQECPKCGSKNLDKLQRITGYLVGTTDRWNKAKLSELNDRVIHE